MKKFSLNEHIANPSLKVVTRDGKPVRIICTDAKGNYPVIALILNEGKEFPENYTENGILVNNNINDKDLFFAPTKREGFVNIYNRDNRLITGVTIHQTEEDAKRFIFPNSGYITTIKIHWEE